MNFFSNLFGSNTSNQQQNASIAPPAENANAQGAPPNISNSLSPQPQGLASQPVPQMQQESNATPMNDDMIPLPQQSMESNYVDLSQMQQQSNSLNYMEDSGYSTINAMPIMQQQNNAMPIMQQQNNAMPIMQQQNNALDDSVYMQMPQTNSNAMPNFSSFSSASNSRRSRQKARIMCQEVTFDKVVNEEDEIVAVVVTIFDGSSYDAMFRQVAQEDQDGTRVVTWAINTPASEKLLDVWQGKTEALDRINDDVKANLEKLIGQIGHPELDADCVVFNWECCSGCTDAHFAGPRVQELIKALMDRGHMAMCSDFSLKALVGTWNEDILGPNPFVKIGTFGSSFNLGFDPAVLADCPSTQLQKVGELCDNGTAHVHAMGGTIGYAVNPVKADTDAYVLQILSVAYDMPGCPCPREYQSTINSRTGAAGHVLLTYPSGGQLLTSAGHWIELVKLDVSEDRLRQVMNENFNAEFNVQMESDYAKCNTQAERLQTTQQYASLMVQKSAPCMNKRVKRSKGYY